ncbi:unnamed protein product [Lupinus luteus]|uniref:Uncharacterized protein n=1 Tax=Lupinus luteus TaxID=3873 RepID=A0AAV1WRM3_LUPLU
MGRWDEAEVVRDLMSDNQICKNPGYSCWAGNIPLICYDAQELVGDPFGEVAKMMTIVEYAWRKVIRQMKVAFFHKQAAASKRPLMLSKKTRLSGKQLTAPDFFLDSGESSRNKSSYDGPGKANLGHELQAPEKTCLNLSI